MSFFLFVLFEFSDYFQIVLRIPLHQVIDMGLSSLSRNHYICI